MCIWTRKNGLNLGSRPLLDPDPGIQHCEIGHCSTSWLISLENWSDLCENFITDVSLGEEVRAEFWKLSGVWTLDVDQIHLGRGLRAL